MRLYKNPTFKLKKKDIREIVNIKNSHWNFGISSQLKWFNDKKNVFKNDLHFYLKKNSKVIAYVQLGKRKYIINLKKKNYILFRTLVVLKNERGKNFSKKIMHEVLKLIKMQKLPCFLLCKKKLIKFYEVYNFIRLDKKKYKMGDHQNLLSGMICGLNKKDMNKIKTFYYNI